MNTQYTAKYLQGKIDDINRRLDAGAKSTVVDSAWINLCCDLGNGADLGEIPVPERRTVLLHAVTLGARLALLDGTLFVDHQRLVNWILAVDYMDFGLVQNPED
jgi:hypothetical protein